MHFDKATPESTAALLADGSRDQTSCVGTARDQTSRDQTMPTASDVERSQFSSQPAHVSAAVSASLRVAERAGECMRAYVSTYVHYVCTPLMYMSAYVSTWVRKYANK